MSRLQKVFEQPRADASFQPHDRAPLLDQLDELKRGLRQSQAPDGDCVTVKAPPPSIVQSARTGTKNVLQMIIRARANRSKFLPANLFADPAWDMLLDLYLADILCKRINVSSLCSASNVPATTALRWMGALEREGLIFRMEDVRDGRRIFVSLSQDGLARMDRYFESLPELGDHR